MARREDQADGGELMVVGRQGPMAETGAPQHGLCMQAGAAQDIVFFVIFLI